MKTDGSFHPLDSRAQLNKARAQSETEPVVLFKHSVACGLSTTARRQMQQLSEERPLAVYELVIQASRLLSNEVAAELGIPHASPQVIVLFKREPVFHASHQRVTAAVVRAAIQKVLLQV